MKFKEKIRPLEKGNFRRILVIKWSAMGDIVIASALMQDICAAFPQARIDLNILPPWDRLFRHDPRFSDILAIDLKGRESGLKGMLRWLRTVRARRYDLIIDLQSNDRTRFLMILLRLSGAGGLFVGNHRRYPYHIGPAPDQQPLNAFRHQQKALQAAGIPTLTPRPVLHVQRENMTRVDDIQRRYGLRPGTFGIFLPGSQAAGHLKRWGARRYAALATLLHQAGLEKIVLVGGRDEMEECERICQSCQSDWLVNLCGQTEILDIIPLAASSRLIVANDTGTAHVASCTDRPMWVICGPTDPRRVKPAGENVRAIQAEIPCINCYRKTCDHHTCMEAVPPEQVFEALKPALTS